MLGFLSVSCSSDDNNAPPVEKIVGEWKITDVWLNGEEGYEEMVEAFPCIVDNRQIFNLDYTYELRSYEEDDSGECVLVGVDVGDWELNNSILKLNNQNGDVQEFPIEFINNKCYVETEFDGNLLRVELSRV